MSSKAATSRLTVVVDRNTQSRPWCVAAASWWRARRAISTFRLRQLVPDHKRIVLDFTDLTHMDSSGIGTLVRLYVHAKSADAFWN